ncbi:MAG: exopolysaccharide biosynthesis polyprenyl glycosylphosphotransferase [Armatimonadota bacterium]|nr:exopolysaccharide biosynthesis polyprenyl glycosylphosphotransferase [Armatimonadota bacterium]MDR7439539.1 exopolysaccharide biosynthesis polyprenyl glycosylphosphotransferase [Armatimonadota bacterium]MDR7443225.1 exopolysaccharide biosynthesis polyprenyl glycosylphosphotransferase [Armatimonadota bacterium]MDR7563457.1 exopolysaccharide biosynthesis polyprenyl glycosylphosphotransferase [Armatimonadota bacterium]MDR7567502.1 exopolysaccharide biosynthesis polyprenyl glycosylphosphotransfe
MTSRAASLGRSPALSQPVSRILCVLALIGADLVALGAALAGAVGVRASVLPALSPTFSRPTYPLAHYLQLWWLPVAFLAALAYAGLYTRRMPRWEEIRRCLGAATVGAVLAFALVSVGKFQEDVSRPVLVLTWMGSLVTLPAARGLAKRALFSLGPWRCKTLVVGEVGAALAVASALNRDPSLGYEVVGIVPDWREAPKAAASWGAREVVVLASGLGRSDVLRVVEALRPVAENVLLVPDLAEVPVLSLEVLGLFEDRAVLLRVPNTLLNPWNGLIKRAMDLALGSALALLAAPVVAAAAMAVKLDSSGPAFHVEPRIGRGGRRFPCFKLRTMYVDAPARLEAHLATDPEAQEEWERYRKLRSHDPRVTRVGRFLRRWSLDELPQLWNVLRGEMSLVGPRPYLPEEMALLSADGMLDVSPGMTGLWQVSGRNALDFRTRQLLDRWYVGNWSPWLDLFILLRTPPAILRGEAGR